MPEIVREELLGCVLKVAESTNKSIAGLSGRIVGETRNTLKIEGVGGREKTIIKDQCVFLIKYSNKWIKVDGKELVARPEDRIKKNVKLW
jgi:ribonuclease P protein subunit POP4